MKAVAQRWRDGRDRYRPVGETIDPGRYLVTPIAYCDAKRFVTQHHYSRSFPQIRYAFGLHEHQPGRAGTDLVGVLTLGNGTRAAALTSAFPTLVPYRESLELNRLVLLDHVAANAESWFTARALRTAAECGIRGITTFSDPSELWRTAPDGRRIRIKRGHVGVVYQALNMTYLGRSRPSWKLYFPDGTEISRRSLTKIIGHEPGADGMITRLIARGAPPPGHDIDRRAWLNRALTACGAQRRYHPGNHKYALRTGRSRGERTRTTIPAPRPYPKPTVQEKNSCPFTSPPPNAIPAAPTGSAGTGSASAPTTAPPTPNAPCDHGVTPPSTTLAETPASHGGVRTTGASGPADGASTTAPTA